MAILASLMRGVGNEPATIEAAAASKARKEAEFQAIKDLAEMRRNPQKMAEYEKAVRC